MVSYRKIYSSSGNERTRQQDEKRAFHSAGSLRSTKEHPAIIVDKDGLISRDMISIAELLRGRSKVLHVFAYFYIP